MSESIFSPSWYRVSQLKPFLRSHARIHRHTYRNEVWYIVQDQATGQTYRITPIVYHMLEEMDGKTTVQEIWDNAIKKWGDDAPTQNDLVNLLAQLHSSDIMVCDIAPDTAELSRRSEKIKKRKIQQYLLSPLSWRFPLFDPDKYVTSLMPYVRPFMGRIAFIVWLIIVVAAAVLAFQHWKELTHNISDRILAGQNLFVLWLVYPVVKILHEAGHAFAVKKKGGEVHETGVMLLGLMPVPYVDASASSAFPEKRLRIFVSAAGMMVELFLAAIATLVWLTVEPGLIRSIAYNVMVIGGVSTVVFNGNPLLRYDGYYMFADFLEIPNLAQRSTTYTTFLVKHYCFRIKMPSPYVAEGEKIWLSVYSVSAFIYRIFVYVAIILFISKKFFIIGTILAIWAAISMFVMPIIKGANFLFRSPQLNEKRVRAVSLTLGTIFVLSVFVFFMPMPSWTRAEGVIWVPEEFLVRAETEGFINEIISRPHSKVTKGDRLVLCEEPQLKAETEVLRAQLQLLQARYDAEIGSERVKALLTREEMVPIIGELKRKEEKLHNLVICSKVGGTFIIPGPEDLPGKYLKQGDLIGYVVNETKPTVRVVVSQSDIDLIRHRNYGVEVRLTDDISKILPATIVREVPAADENLPSPALGSGGGGKIAVDPTDQEGVKTLEKMFQVDLELPRQEGIMNIGERVYVRFNHGFEPLAVQWYRSLRRLFLRHFNV